MTREQRSLLLLNLVGGTAVLGSYAWGFLARPDAMSALWGGVPESMRGLYTVNMFLAAGGYMLFTPYLLWRLLPASEHIAGRPSSQVLHACYLAILIPSALWLPLTSWMVESPGLALWWLIRIDLALVGLGSIGLLASIFLAQPASRERTRIAAVIGLLPFILQTAVLDATIWPAYFPLDGI
jgi:hypothetical protein